MHFILSSCVRSDIVNPVSQRCYCLLLSPCRHRCLLTCSTLIMTVCCAPVLKISKVWRYRNALVLSIVRGTLIPNTVQHVQIHYILSRPTESSTSRGRVQVPLGGLHQYTATHRRLPHIQQLVLRLLALLPMCKHLHRCVSPTTWHSILCWCQGRCSVIRPRRTTIDCALSSCDGAQAAWLG